MYRPHHVEKLDCNGAAVKRVYPNQSVANADRFVITSSNDFLLRKFMLKPLHDIKPDFKTSQSDHGLFFNPKETQKAKYYELDDIEKFIKASMPKPNPVAKEAQVEFKGHSNVINDIAVRSSLSCRY